MKRLFDIIFSLIAIMVLSPFMLAMAAWVIADDGFPVFYRQERIGRHGVTFRLLKFRSMYKDADKRGLLTVGERDPRITRSGYFLRKYKLDELPQFFNVLSGAMSIVGPRPEVSRYVKMYSAGQKVILQVKPGITDYASLEYFNENALLARSADPEKTYIDEIMPAKIALNKRYIAEAGLLTDIRIILRTAKRILTRSR